MRVRVGLDRRRLDGLVACPVLAGSPRATELAWVADPDARRSGARLPSDSAARGYQSPDTTDLDAVVIAAPTEFHHELRDGRSSRRVPLLVEKPIADTLGSCRRDRRRHRAQRDTVLMCGLLERFNPAVRTAAEIAREPLHVSDHAALAVCGRESAPASRRIC